MWLVLDYFCDGIYILDIVVHLHTGARQEMTPILTSAWQCLISGS